MTKRTRVLAAAAVLVTALAAGCVHPIRDGSVPRNEAPVGQLDVQVFQGGYGVDFYQQAAREYEAGHPGVKINLKGDPRIWEQLRPRFVAGTPPSLAFPGWGMDHYALIYEHQALDLNEALLTTPYGESTGRWRDTFIPDLLTLGEYQGRTYLMPYYVNLNGWWYNVNLFEQNGWQPPKTYDELLVLGEKIKAKGIAPLTYQGKYPYYALQGFVLPWAIHLGGLEAFRAAEGLEPGAWKAEPFLKAAQNVAELRDKKFFQKGADGLSHTEAQMEFLNGRAAMIPCGTWLESEMKNQMPAGFKMAFMLPPHVPGGKGDASALQVSVEPWLVPTHGTNRLLAIDFFKYLTSKKKAREFVLAKGTLTAIKGSDSGELPPSLRKPAEALRNAKITYTTRYAQWYKSLEEAIRNQMAALLLGSVTPEQFVSNIEAAAEKVRRDPNIPKHKP
jgi:N-acetylglucosamine transport system substrate-binding protein